MKTALLAACLLVGSVGCATSFSKVGQTFAVKQAARQHNCPSWKVRVVKSKTTEGTPLPSWVLNVCGKKYRYQLRVEGSELAARTVVEGSVTRR